MKSFEHLFTLLWLSIIVIVSACAPVAQTPSEQSIQTAIAETQSAQVPQAPSLSELNLDSIPFQPGDLPNQYESGQASYKWADGLPQTVKPDNVVIQKVGWDISSGFEDDYVMVALFKSKQDLDNAFDAATKTYGARIIEPATVGERNAFVMVSTLSGDGFLTFTRCSAFVAIRITGADIDEELLTSYAQRIDKRLKPLICQQ